MGAMSEYVGDGMYRSKYDNDVRCPEAPLRENEAAVVYEALEGAKAELRRIKNSAKYAGGAWASYTADDALSKINDIMKGV